MTVKFPNHRMKVFHCRSPALTLKSTLCNKIKLQTCIWPHDTESVLWNVFDTTGVCISMFIFWLLLVLIISTEDWKSSKPGPWRVLLVFVSWSWTESKFYHGMFLIFSVSRKSVDLNIPRWFIWILGKDFERLFRGFNESRLFRHLFCRLEETVHELNS